MIRVRVDDEDVSNGDEQDALVQPYSPELARAQAPHRSSLQGSGPGESGGVDVGGSRRREEAGGAERRDSGGDGGRHAVGIPFVLTVFALLGWSWHVHVMVMDANLFKNQSTFFLGFVDIVVFHLLFLCEVISYLRIIGTSPGYVPRGWPNNNNNNNNNNNKNIATADRGQGCEMATLGQATNEPADPARFCEKCQCQKPERSHHCRVCQRCVLKMDHHCPWVNNCVGHYNHKYFILFIWYTVAIGLYNCFTLFLWAYPMREEDQDLLFDEFYLWANVGVSGIFGGLQIFFGVHHINLVRANSTTIELIGTRGRIKSKARQRTWDLGAKANMRQVFGSRRITWALPCVQGCEGDGYSYPKRNGDAGAEAPV